MKLKYLLAMLITMLAHTASADAVYGALAINRSAVGQYGLAVGASSSFIADSSARADCGWPTAPCTVVLRFGPRQCIAYAVEASSNAAGWGISRNAEQAEETATGNCAANGAKGFCNLLLSQCY